MKKAPIAEATENETKSDRRYELKKSNSSSLPDQDQRYGFPVHVSDPVLLLLVRIISGQSRRFQPRPKEWGHDDDD